MENYKEILDKIKPEFDKVIKFFEGELAKIRTSRATPALVEDIMVDCFDQKFPLKQLGAISSPEPRQLLIQPWDKSYVEPMQKALALHDISSTPYAKEDQNFIRIELPPLTEDYRKELIRLLSEKQEQARQTMRRWREEAWRQVQDGFKDGKVREDDKFRAKEDLQKLIDDYGKKIDDLGEKKKQEIAA